MKESALPVKESGLRWLWLALLLFVLDIGVKYLVMNQMGYGWSNRIEILPFFNLLYVHNYGAAFSFLGDQSGWQRYLFTGLAFVFSLVLMTWMRKLPKSAVWLSVAYASIIGGALGNAYDRVLHGYVVDYLDFYWGTYHWPAFNIADMAIVIGAAMIILDGFFSKEKTESNPSSSK
jgi:signal peptidase II